MTRSNREYKEIETDHNETDTSRLKNKTIFFIFIGTPLCMPCMSSCLRNKINPLFDLQIQHVNNPVDICFFSSVPSKNKIFNP